MPKLRTIAKTIALTLTAATGLYLGWEGRGFYEASAKPLIQSAQTAQLFRSN